MNQFTVGGNTGMTAPALLLLLLHVNDTLPRNRFECLRDREIGRGEFHPVDVSAVCEHCMGIDFGEVIECWALVPVLCAIMSGTPRRLCKLELENYSNL